MNQSHDVLEMTDFALPDIPSDASIVILTGAGISKESGLDTFRDQGGVWSKVRIEDVATPEAFERDPARVQAFYNDRRAGLLNDDIQPNAAHEALSRLKRSWPGDVMLVTQNVDDLHERGGYPDPLHMHGELLQTRCLACEAVLDWRAPITDDTPCGACESVGTLRPNVVWFGEMPIGMERIYAALARCALFVSIGTSGNVYPAAGFVEEARFVGGAHTIELNLEPSAGVTEFHSAHQGPATRIVPAFVETLLRRVGR